jgi:hypothetical protein
MFRNLQNNAYNAFDPGMTKGSHWDPSVGNRFNNASGSTGQAATNVVAAAQGQKMQTNVNLNNNAAVNITFELFNWLTSATRVLNPMYATGHYLMIPLLTFEGLAATIAGTGGTIGFSDSGNLLIHGLDTTPDPIPSIGCQEVAYSSFFEASSISPFQVAYFRLTVTSDPQIDQTIKWFQKTFSGGMQQNVISPRAYFKPTQFQDFVIDITVSFTIALDEGINVVVLPGNNLRFSLFIEMWTVNGVAA